MSSAPMQSLDQRERRAKERAAQLDAIASGQPRSARKDMSARSDLSARRDAGYIGPPRPGEGSLFDNYANLQDPHKFSTDEEEVEELMRMGVGWTQHSEADERYLEANWDPSPHKNPPAYLKAIKPITREPWTIDADVYNRAFNTADFGKPTRYGVDLFNMGTPVHADEVDVDPKKRPKGVKKTWNAQTFRQVPYALRGLKPASTSTEPWVFDQRNRKGDFEDNDVIENITHEEMDNGAAAGFKKGAFKAYKEERNRKLHADAWDSSTRTW